MSKWLNKTGTRTYYAWRAMRHRCLYATNDSYKHYGGRGIAVCAAWLNDFDAFIMDMGECQLGLSLDRIDPDKDYSKDNCRWATVSMQQNNRRNNIVLEFGGLCKTMAQWAQHLGIGKSTLCRRLKRGMSLERAFTVGMLRCGLVHGTHNAYEKLGCKCKECQAGNTKRHQRLRKERRDLQNG